MKFLLPANANVFWHSLSCHPSSVNSRSHLGAHSKVSHYSYPGTIGAAAQLPATKLPQCTGTQLTAVMIRSAAMCSRYNCRCPGFQTTGICHKYSRPDQLRRHHVIDYIDNAGWFGAVPHGVPGRSPTSLDHGSQRSERLLRAHRARITGLDCQWVSSDDAEDHDAYEEAALRLRPLIDAGYSYEDAARALDGVPQRRMAAAVGKLLSPVREQPLLNAGYSHADARRALLGVPPSRMAAAMRKLLSPEPVPRPGQQQRAKLARRTRGKGAGGAGGLACTSFWYRAAVVRFRHTTAGHALASLLARVCTVRPVLAVGSRHWPRLSVSSHARRLACHALCACHHPPRWPSIARPTPRRLGFRPSGAWATTPPRPNHVYPGMGIGRGRAPSGHVSRPAPR